jgi:flagellar protein FliL
MINAFLTAPLRDSARAKPRGRRLAACRVSGTIGMSEAEAASEPRRGGRKLTFLVLIPLVLLLCGGGAAMFLGVVPSPFSADAAAAWKGPERDPPDDPLQVVFISLPDILVNLNVSGRRLRFLKFVAALEVRDQEDAALVQQFMPRISDNFHSYMRAVQAEDLAGPEAVYRVKRDLLARVNQVVRPVQVRDVLIKEMLVQ